MTWEINLKCCRQCIDPDECEARRQEMLKIELHKVTCEGCGGPKPDDGIPVCRSNCVNLLTDKEDNK